MQIKTINRKFILLKITVKKMVLTQQASQHKPKRPITGYFKFRLQKLMQLKDVQNKNKKTLQLYVELDQKEKQKLHDQFEEEMKKYHEEMQKWKKEYGVNNQDMKRYSRRKKRSYSEYQQDQKRMVKRRGQSRAEMNKRKMEHARRGKEEKHHGKNGRKRRSRSKETGRSDSVWEDEQFSPEKQIKRISIKEPESKQMSHGKRSSSRNRKISGWSKSKGHRVRSKSKQ